MSNFLWNIVLGDSVLVAICVAATILLTESMVRCRPGGEDAVKHLVSLGLTIVAISGGLSVFMSMLWYVVHTS